MGGRIITFLRESRAELKKVRWPTREQTIQYTLAVIAVSAVLALFLGGLDYVFQTIVDIIIL